MAIELTKERLKDIRLTNQFLNELVYLCEKYQVVIEASGDYDILISRYEDGKYHREFLMNEIANVSPEGINELD